MSQNGFTARHDHDDAGNPTGGVSNSTGVSIFWQNGPLGRGEEKQRPNGAFVEDVIVIARDRLEFYQAGKFKCEENEVAISHLSAALTSLEKRTAD